VKKIWVMVFLVSLGLNLGLGLRLLKNQGQVPPCDEEVVREKPYGRDRRHSPGDTTVWRQMAERRLDRLANHLNLTADQKKVFAQTRAEVGNQMMVRRQEMHSSRTHLLDLVSDESTTPETLRHSIMDLAARQSEIDSVITEVLLKELEVLDADQRILYLDMLPMNNRGHAGMQGRGRGRGRPD